MTEPTEYKGAKRSKGMQTGASRGDSLTLDLGLPKQSVGRHERAVARQLLAAQREGRLDSALHAATASTLRGLGRALDGAERKGDPYAAAQVARVILDTLDRSGLLPTSGGEQDDASDLGQLLHLGRSARNLNP